MFVAVRRGQIAALITALLSVAVLNFFFIEPRYRLTIADSHNVAALGVFLIAALVVGRLAAAARRQATEAERRATLAMARERESTILADAASSLLAGRDLEAELASPGGGDPANDGSARVGLTSAPDQREGELAVPLTGDSSGMALRPTRRGLGPLEPRASGGGARGTDRRGTRAPTAGIAVSRDRGHPSRRRGQDSAPTRHLARPPFAAHRDHHGGQRAQIHLGHARGSPRLDRCDRIGVRPARGPGGRFARLVANRGSRGQPANRLVRPRRRPRAGHRAGGGAPRASGGARPAGGAPPGAGGRGPARARVLEPAPKRHRVLAGPRCGAHQRGTGSRQGDDPCHGPRARIPRAKRAEIFEPFVRGHDDGQGSGLGLAICRGLVEANGGEIRLESTTGHETTFAVSFPLIPQPAEAR